MSVGTLQKIKDYLYYAIINNLNSRNNTVKVSVVAHRNDKPATILPLGNSYQESTIKTYLSKLQLLDGKSDLPKVLKFVKESISLYSDDDIPSQTQIVILTPGKIKNVDKLSAAMNDFKTNIGDGVAFTFVVLRKDVSEELKPVLIYPDQLVEMDSANELADKFGDVKEIIKSLGLCTFYILLQFYGKVKPYL